jgi:hypothetical protein
MVGKAVPAGEGREHHRGGDEPQAGKQNEPEAGPKDQQDDFPTAPASAAAM